MRTLAIVLALLMSSAAFAANDITGVVVDAEAKPVPGAYVYVYYAFPKKGVSPLCPSCYRDCGKKDQVDANGAFRLEQLDETLRFDLLAVAEGYEPLFVRQAEPAKSPVTITMKPRPASDKDKLIIGTVVDPKGKPVVGALVESAGYRIGRRIGWGNIPGVDRLSVTDEKGSFSLRIPDPTASLDVRVTGRNYAPVIDRQLVPGMPRTVRLTEGATISGYVKKNGQPVEGARVAVVQRLRMSERYLGRFEIGTNEHGLFVLTNMGPDEEWVVYVPRDGVQGGVVEPKVVRTGSDRTDVDAGTFTVVAGRRIGGTVVLPAGKTIPPDTKILLASTLHDGTLMTELRPDGRFLFEQVPPGEAHVNARIAGLTMSPRSFDPERSFAGALVPATGDCVDLRLIFEEEKPQ